MVGGATLMEPVTLSVNLSEAIEDLQLGLNKEQVEYIANDIKRGSVSYTHLTLPTTPYV